MAMNPMESRWIPPDDERVPINIHPEVNVALRNFLLRDLQGTGIGYSEFIFRSIAMWRNAMMPPADETYFNPEDDPFYPKGTDW